MGWWERYQTWQPENSWDRYQAWRLESRVRFAATFAATRVLFVFLWLWLVSDSSAGKLFLTTGIAVPITLISGWLWYPRVKAKVRYQVTVSGRSS